MRVIYNKLSKEVVQVVDDENSITAYPANLSVIQGDGDMIVLSAVAIGLDLSQIPNLNMTPERIKVLQRIKRCNEVKIRFLEENAKVTIEPQESAAQLQAFMTVMLLLDVGDAKTALGAVVQMPNSAFVVTPPYESAIERKQTYIDELSQIVSDLFEA